MYINKIPNKILPHSPKITDQIADKIPPNEFKKSMGQINISENFIVHLASINHLLLFIILI